MSSPPTCRDTTDTNSAIQVSDYYDKDTKYNSDWSASIKIQNRNFLPTDLEQTTFKIKSKYLTIIFAHQFHHICSHRNQCPLQKLILSLCPFKIKIFNEPLQSLTIQLSSDDDIMYSGWYGSQLTYYLCITDSTHYTVSVSYSHSDGVSVNTKHTTCQCEACRVRGHLEMKIGI